ncbi:MAG TPA: YpdA family putative bacillithiol disulfide reductase [Gemmatimonadaceae bacterium]|nr:YpdA family putative bacillithiol disulfide reductase [Gemmatimonadaceae bacterium]
MVLDLAIVGAGPCGIAAAIAAGRAGLRALAFDAGPVVNSITQYPTYATFFSTAEKLSLGGVPFVISGEKPTRRDALAYYRAIVRHFAIDVRQFEPVRAIEREVDGRFLVRSRRHAGGEERTTRAANVLVATGYWGSPNWLNVPGERLPHVTHAYREGHEAFLQNAVVVGGGNSAAEAALDLWRSGARVTLVHFGPTFDMKIKPWVLPDFTNRAAEGSIAARWNRRVVSIDPEAMTVRPSDGAGPEERIPADHVYLMTGFKPNVSLLEDAGVPIDPRTGIPAHDPETLETSVPGLFIAGVVVAGFDANKVFIENGRFHGDRIVARILGRPAPAEPVLSRELDT